MLYDSSRMDENAPTLDTNELKDEQDTNIETPVVEEEKSRTAEQFEKLKDSNKTLKDERDTYKNLLDSLLPSDAEMATVTPPVKETQPDIAEDLKAMVDEDGYLDGAKLTETLKEINERAKRAEQKVARIEEHNERVRVAKEQNQKTALMRSVHEKYPSLDPESGVFDKDFYEAVRNDLIGQMMEGKEDPMLAADKWSDKLYGNTERQIEVTKEEKEAKDTKEDQKAQINAIRPRSSSMVGYYKEEENDILMDKVRQGKKGALAEILRRRGQ